MHDVMWYLYDMITRFFCLLTLWCYSSTLLILLLWYVLVWFSDVRRDLKYIFLRILCYHESDLFLTDIPQYSIKPQWWRPLSWHMSVFLLSLFVARVCVAEALSSSLFNLSVSSLLYGVSACCVLSLFVSPGILFLLVATVGSRISV